MREVEVRYLVRDGARIAYEVFGSGPVDLLVVRGGAQFPIDLMWELRQLAEFMDGLGAWARVIVYDSRGTGASDPLPTSDGAAGLESGAADILAVLEAAGSERPSILDLGYGSFAVFMAATYPERVRSIILTNLRSSFPQLGVLTSEQRIETAAWLATVSALQAYNPRVSHDPELQRWWGRAHRLNASPQVLARTIEFAGNTDIESLLDHVRVPTLVFHRRENRIWDIETSHAAAAAIANCRFVELPGSESDLYLGDIGTVLAEIRQFLKEDDLVERRDRPLATVMFTDIVASTEHLAAIGDQRWKQLLDEHDGLVDRTVARYGGRLVKTLGDGVLATFDGPARAVRCAADLRDAMEMHGIGVRAGLHTGEIELRNTDVTGLAVHTASRISALAGAGEILVSRTVVDLTSGSGIRFDPRGSYDLKGIAGSWPLYAARVPEIEAPG